MIERHIQEAEIVQEGWIFEGDRAVAFDYATWEDAVAAASQAEEEVEEGRFKLAAVCEAVYKREGRSGLQSLNGELGRRYTDKILLDSYVQPFTATRNLNKASRDALLSNVNTSMSLLRAASPLAQYSPEVYEEKLEEAVDNAESVADFRKRIQPVLQRLKRNALEGETTSPVKAKLYNLPATALINSIDEQSVDLLITDPPYSTDVDDMPAFLDEWLYAALDMVKDTGRAFICTGNYPHEVAEYLNRLLPYERLAFGNVLAWTYRNTLGPAPAHIFKNNWQAIFYLYGPDAEPLNTDQLTEKFSVLDIAAPDGRHGNRYHAWQKPDGLAERLIRLSTSPGARVVDPFCGTGTFCIEAARMGRDAIGTDIDADALAIASDLGAEVNYAG